MEKKSLTKNYLFDLLYSMLQLFIPIITTPYISRILEAEGVGKISYVQNIVTYFVLFATLGIPNYGVKQIACAQKNVSHLYYELFRINLISNVSISILYYVLIFNVGYFQEDRILYVIFGFNVLSNIFNIDWFYRGMEEFRYIAIRSCIIKIVSVVCIFLFVKTKIDIYWYAGIMVCSTSLNHVINAVHAKKYLIRTEEPLHIARHLKKVVILFSTTIAVQLYTILDTTMVGALCGMTPVGYYNNAMKLIKIITVAITSIGTVMLPRLSQYYFEQNLEAIKGLLEKSIGYLLFLSIPCTFGILILSKYMVALMFGATFQPAVLTLQILSFLIPILAIGNLFGTQLLMAIGAERKLMYSVFLGASINVTLNWLLIPRYQQNGAAIASVIAETIVMIFQVRVGEKLSNFQLRNRVYGIILVQTLGMVVVLLCILGIPMDSQWNVLIAIASGIFVYFGLGLLLKNELELDILRRIGISKLRNYF